MTDTDWRTWLPTGTEQPCEGAGTDGASEDEFVAEFVDDDPVGALAADVRRRSQAAAARRAVRTRVVGLGGAVGLVAVLAAGVMVWSQRGDSHAAAPAAAVVAATSTAAAPVWCPESATPAKIVGRGRGRAPDAPGATGPQVILWQQYAWYRLRDADAARAVLAEDAVAAPVESARAAVAAIPTDTQHCVTITPLAADRWDVRIDELHADGSQEHWQQTVTTATQGGRTVITSILATPAGGER